MNDILSQSEIDDLLKALSTGEIDPNEIETTSTFKKIKPYDFKRPNKFAKEHLRTLQSIFDNYSRLLSSYLAGKMRTVTNVEVLSVEEVTFHEFHNSLSNPVFLSIVDFKPMKGTILVEVLPNVAFGIIDRLLGGYGAAVERIREFTDIEITLLEKVMKQMMELLVGPWENVMDLRPELQKIETNTQFAQIYSPNEMIALVTISISVGQTKGMINVCIPHMTVEPVISKLNTKHWFATNKDEEKSQGYRPILENKLHTAKVPVRAILGGTDVLLSDVLQLCVGDVIKLDKNQKSELDIVIGKETKFTGVPGIHNGKMAIQVVSKLRRED